MSDESGAPHAKKKPRSLGRRLAMQYLYAADLVGFGEAEPLDVFLEIQRQAENEAGSRDAPSFDDPHWRAAAAFARDLVRQALARREVYDQRLAGVAEHWDLGRIAAVERAILRLAAAELDLGEVDAPVAIDEAVRLAKLFGGKESGAFVNGVLDALKKHK